LLEKDFKLSKTEFVAYLKCPLLFYLTRELNKKTEALPPILLSDYELFLRKGIEKHRWLQFFYQKYAAEIQNGNHPKLSEKDKNEPWKKQFTNFEVNRYKDDPKLWEPAAIELYLSKGKYCGKIDRIDELKEKGHCRVVEYKSLPREFDEEELLFYAVLLTELLPVNELPNITKVSEIGIYYYSTGEFLQAKVTSEIITIFKEFVEGIRIEMLDDKLIKKKDNCDFDTTNCLERDICRRIVLSQ